MVRRAVSVVAGDPARAHPGVRPLEANAYACAEALDLAIVLRDAGIEHAVRRGEPAAADGRDLRCLLESGIAVVADAAGVDRRGLTAADLLEGVELRTPDEVAALLAEAEAVLFW